jgi:hypothetical protein
LAFDEIVLRALLQGLRGQHLVVQTRQHHQRDAGCGGVDPLYRFQSLRIGQPQVDQDDINRMLSKNLFGATHAFRVHQFGVAQALLSQHLAEQAGVAGVVFDQENLFDQFFTGTETVSISCCLLEKQN